MVEREAAKGVTRESENIQEGDSKDFRGYGRLEGHYGHKRWSVASKW